ncbi:MAG TPA: hypothetical protein GX717_07120, partial [Clostridiaceae bacterium]|nr:hypothetical protein [Clostridiaceae bacterium]
MKRNSIVLMAIILAIMSVLSGCGSGNGDAPSSQSAVPVEEFEPVVLKFTNSSQESQYDTNTNVQAICYFRDEVEKRTDGNVKIEIYWGGALASSNEDIVNGLQTGGFDFNLNGHGVYGDYTDAFFPFSVPYLLQSDEEYAEFVDDP